MIEYKSKPVFATLASKLKWLKREKRAHWQ
jgi:hypothetical protein